MNCSTESRATRFDIVSLLPSRIVEVLRKAELKHLGLAHNTRPLSWVVPALSRRSGVIEALAIVLGGLYMTALKGMRAEPCCGGHETQRGALFCLPSEYQAGLFLRIPHVGLFMADGDGWELIDNYLAQFPPRELLRTIETVKRAA